MIVRINGNTVNTKHIAFITDVTRPFENYQFTIGFGNSRSIVVKLDCKTTEGLKAKKTELKSLQAEVKKHNAGVKEQIEKMRHALVTLWAEGEGVTVIGVESRIPAPTGKKKATKRTTPVLPANTDKLPRKRGYTRRKQY